MRNYIFLMLFIFSSLSIYAAASNFDVSEENEIVMDGKLVGKIVDQSNNTPIEYANVAIYNASGELETGGITDARGHFSIKDIDPGEYYIEIKFIGFEDTKIENIVITADSKRLNAGVIKLSSNVANLEGVEVVAEKKAIQYKIDKKVVNPSQFLTSAGGSAVDILANTPSITVDVEGNVTLRGSSNFTVLIDGKPTPFDATDALEQVPASQIENIEIITNPSVKYDPDGTAGIINIITKSNRAQGVNGIINLDANSLGSLGGDFLLNFQREKFSFYVGGSRSDRKRKGAFKSLTETYQSDTSYLNSQDGNGGRGHSGNTLKTGLSFNIDTTSSLAINLNGGDRMRKHTNDVDYLTWEEVDGMRYNEITSTSTNNSISNGKYLSADITYDKNFNDTGHELITTLFYQYGASGEDNINEVAYNSGLFEGLRSWEIGDGHEVRFKTDYTYPITSTFGIEAGYQWRYDNEAEWYDRFDYFDSGAEYSPGESSDYYKTTDFIRHIHSTYATIGGELNRFGYKVGLRGEYTDRSIDFFANSNDNGSENYAINRFDFFPSIHLSYALPANVQVMASYSKRIERPRGYYLEPFETWMNAYNVRQGNPDLQPEYIDSWELGAQKTFEKGFLSVEAFYRKTENRIDRIQSVYVDPATNDTSTNIILQKSMNAGRDYSLGFEGMLNYEFTNWYSLNFNGSFFNYRLETTIDDQYVERESQNWGLRMSNTFKPFRNNRIQFDVMYRSPSVSSQGRREGFAFTNIAVRQDVLKRKLSITLSVQDLFDTARFKMTSEGTNFASVREWDMQSPVIRLQLSYKLNNFMPDRNKNGEGENGESMDMDGGF